MPKKRRRITKRGDPAPCGVSIAGNLAVFLYDAWHRSRRYKDETELVNEIVRAWTQGRDVPNWAELREQLRPLEPPDPDEGKDRPQTGAGGGGKIRGGRTGKG